jgi:hypothetical protein
MYYSQNALGLAGFCYWGEKKSNIRKKIKDLFGNYKSDTFFFSSQSDWRLQSVDVLTFENFLK